MSYPRPGESSTFGRSSFQSRIDAVRDRADIVSVVGAAVVLRGGRNVRGKCPFHGSSSDSFAVYPDKGNARCWGCGWSGDVIRFVADHYGLGFTDALEQLESDHGLAGLSAAPVRREKQAIMPQRQERARVSSSTMARYLWRSARPHPEAVRTYFRARGVPEAMLGDERFCDIRFHGLAPLTPWPVLIGKSGPVDYSAPPKGWPNAPAIVALVRRAPHIAGEAWEPVGVHVTFLAPDLAGKMERRRGDGSLYPERKMLGRVAGGCVVLGRYAPDCPLFVGEGLETVLSGMALAGAGPEGCGLAVLSLDNLQGFPKLWKNGIWPLHDIRPDPERAPALAFAHDGPVIGLIDADMAPLRGPQDRATGKRLGLPLVERRGGPIVQRAITTAERAAICAELFVKSWRGAGTRRVAALRPRMGQDCNDAVRQLEGVE